MSGDVMMFPDTVEEFMESYKIVDSEQVYTNGDEFVPIFRMRQWFDHVERSPDEARGAGCLACKCKEPLPEDAMTHEFFIRGNMLWYYDQLFGWERKRISFCPFCGARLEVSEDA